MVSLCVLQDVVQDLKIAAKGSRSPYRREFVLPDGVSNFRGYVKVCVYEYNRCGYVLALCLLSFLDCTLVQVL